MSSQNTALEALQVVDKLPLKGKYDGRKNNGSQERLISRSKYHLNLQRNKAAKTLKTLDLLANAEDLYKLALERKDLDLALRIRQSLEYRAYGKPHTAVPEPQENTPQDSRVAIAVRNLQIVQAPIQQAVIPVKRGRGRPRKHPLLTQPAPTTDQVIEAGTKPVGGL